MAFNQLNAYTEPPVLMAAERAQTDFNPRLLNFFLDGGEAETLANEAMMQQFERDPLFNNKGYDDLSKEELRILTFQRIGRLVPLLSTDSDKDRSRRLSMLTICDPPTNTRSTVHFGLFYNAIKGSGTPKQFNYWWNQKGARTAQRFYGSFGMTELGHGSNVAALETTATFDRATDEFVIHTPHVNATKWWIGGAATTSTHTACFARLIIDGKDHGVKTFVVPLRNVEDHSLLPGISVGDIGKKMGRDGVDNGWIQFNQVRIPRQYMLMKYATVDREGNVTSTGNDQLAYSALIAGRVSMVTDSFNTSKKFITIALRYAAVRRQFSTTADAPETKLIDYVYHQRRLIPLLAQVYAMKFGSADVIAMYDEATSVLNSVNPSNKVALDAAVKDIKELFSTSAALKAFTTWNCAEVIDQARQACGGHGYSQYTGFGRAYDEWVIMCTWEGDNNVLTLSAGRALIQSALSARKGESLGTAVAYLSRSNELASAKLGSRSLLDDKVLLQAWESVSAKVINDAADQFVELTTKRGLTKEQAFEELSQERFLSAKLNATLFLVRSFYHRISSFKFDNQTSAFRPHLLNLANLYALYAIEKNSGLFLQSGFLQTSDIKKVTHHINDLCKAIRPAAIGLTDAFGLSDFFINSSIGNYDGDVYKHYFDKVKTATPSGSSKAPYYDEVMKPFFLRPDQSEVNPSELE